MRLDSTHKLQPQVTSASPDEITYDIDPSNMGMAIAQFHTYQQPAPSIVREITSNALDSHMEAEAYSKLSWNQIILQGWTTFLSDGDEINQEQIAYAKEMEEVFRGWTPQPVEVELVKSPLSYLKEENSRLLIHDFGVGLSPDRIKKVYSKFFSSTKRGTNKQIGAFGLGGKSPLGYTDFFTVTTRWRGIEYVWAIHRGERAPIIRKMDEYPTDRPNGTTVEVVIDRGDEGDFERAIIEQLAYFDNVRYKGVDLPEGDIIRGRHFYYRDNSPFNKIHLCLGKVYYPLDINAMGWWSDSEDKRYQARNMPIALHFTMDEVSKDGEPGKVSILWNRENIQYNSETVAAINHRLDEVRKEILNIYESQQSSVQSMEDFYDVVEGKKTKSIEITQGVWLHGIDDFLNFTATYPKYGMLKKLPTNNIFLRWETYKLVLNGSLSSRDASFLSSVNTIIKNKVSAYNMMRKSNYSPKKNKYIDWKGENEFYLIRPRLVPDQTVWSLFGYGIEPSEDVKILIEAFLDEVDNFVYARTDCYEDVEPSEEYEEWRKEQRKRNKRLKSRRGKNDNEFPIKILEIKDGSSKDPYKWTMAYMGEDDAYDSTSKTIYGFQDDDAMLRRVAPIFFRCSTFSPSYSDILDSRRAKILKIAMGNESYFSDNPHAMHVNDFIASKDISIRRHVTSYLLQEKIMSQVNGLVHDTLANVAPRIYKSAVFLKEYVKTYYLGSNVAPVDVVLVDYFRNQEIQRLKSVAKQKRLRKRLLKKGVDLFSLPSIDYGEPSFDPIAIEHMKRVSAFLKAFPLLGAIDLNRVGTDELKSYFYLYGTRVDPELTAKVINRK